MGWPAAAAIFTALWFLVPLRAVFGAEDVIYMAGIPDSWPLEYYDSQSKNYQGVLPDILEEAAGQSGLGIHYVDPSEQTNAWSWQEIYRWMLYGHWTCPKKNWKRRD